MEKPEIKIDTEARPLAVPPPPTGTPRVAVAPDCLLNAFDDAKEALMQAEEIMETIGLQLHDIQEALAHLYEARTHLYYDEANDKEEATSHDRST